MGRVAGGNRQPGEYKEGVFFFYWFDSLVVEGCPLLTHTHNTHNTQVNNPYIWTSGRTDIFTLQPATKFTSTGDVMYFLATYDATRAYILAVTSTSRLASNLAPVVGAPALITTGE